MRGCVCVWGGGDLFNPILVIHNWGGGGELFNPILVIYNWGGGGGELFNPVLVICNYYKMALFISDQCHVAIDPG